MRSGGIILMGGTRSVGSGDILLGMGGAHSRLLLEVLCLVVVLLLL